MLIAITGGIGAGKSVVSKMLMAMGYEVYDCDRRARQLIDNSREILGEISARISAEVVNDEWKLDRRALAAIVFNLLIFETNFLKSCVVAKNTRMMDFRMTMFMLALIPFR